MKINKQKQQIKIAMNLTKEEKKKIKKEVRMCERGKEGGKGEMKKETKGTSTKNNYMSIANWYVS